MSRQLDGVVRGGPPLLAHRSARWANIGSAAYEAVAAAGRG